MKRTRVEFEHDGEKVLASGLVWDSLFVDDLYLTLKDEDDNTVYVPNKEYEFLKETAEEMIVDKAMEQSQEVRF